MNDKHGKFKLREWKKIKAIVKGAYIGKEITI